MCIRDSLDRVYQTVKSFGEDKVVIGEVWEDASNKISYGNRRHYLLGSQLDSVMNYPFRNAILHYMTSSMGLSRLWKTTRLRRCTR